MNRLGLTLMVTALGCGGGGSASKLGITDDNAPEVASEAVITGQAANNTANPMSAAAVARLNSGAIRHVGAAVRAPADGEAACAISGSSTTTTSGQTSAKIVFAHCDDGDGKVLDGTLGYTIDTGSSSSALAFAVDVDLTVTEGNLVFEEHGGYKMTLTITLTGSRLEEFELTGDGLDLTLSEGGAVRDQLTMSSFDFHTTVDVVAGQGTESSSEVDYDIDSSRLGGSISVTTTNTMKQRDESHYPYTGTVVVTGANATRLEITIHGDESYVPPSGQGQVELKVDSGTGSFGASAWISWSVLASMSTTAP